MSEIDYIGPFETHAVVIDGRRVPWLDATPVQGGIVHLTLDGRLGLEISLADAERVVPFIADAIAIGMGYASFPAEGAEPTRRPDFPKWVGLFSVPEGDSV